MVAASSSGRSQSYCRLRSRIAAVPGIRNEPSGLSTTPASRDIVLVGDLAHDLLDDVFEGHETHERAVFVDDEREVRPAPAEGIELLVERRGLRHEPGFAHDRHDIEAAGVGQVGVQRP